MVTNLPVEGLCSLVLSDPDGHLLDHQKELLHWMMCVVGGREAGKEGASGKEEGREVGGEEEGCRDEGRE